MPDGYPRIDVDVVTRLVAEQFPQWADLPIRPVDLDGWDHRTFRLGDELSVRLPSHPAYAAQVEKEQRWLPRLAPHLPLPIPVPVGRGKPGQGYPLEWSIYRWMPGEPALPGKIADSTEFALTLADFLAALYRIPVEDGPVAGPHSFYRGGSLSVYDDETRRSIDILRDEVDPVLATDVWEAALAAPWPGPPVWAHGDIAFGNLLVIDGKLSAVIDFGSSAVGDPACDTVISWTMFSGESREAYRRALPVEPGAWVRGRGWALWKALITVAGYRETDPAKADESRQVIAEVLAEHRRET